MTHNERIFVLNGGEKMGLSLYGSKGTFVTDREKGEKEKKEEKGDLQRKSYTMHLILVQFKATSWIAC